MAPMRRPLPTTPRGPRRKPRLPSEVLLGIPRIAPDWELGALRALMKPQTKSAILHRPARQRWPRNALTRIAAASEIAINRLGFEPCLHLPQAGDFFLVMTLPRPDLPRAMAFAVVLSTQFPDLWLTLGSLYLRNGRFFRRERRFKFRLVPAGNVHLSRELRAAVRGATGMMPPMNGRATTREEAGRQALRK